jgi:hypothetical protein
VVKVGDVRMFENVTYLVVSVGSSVVVLVLESDNVFFVVGSTRTHAPDSFLFTDRAGRRLRFASLQRRGKVGKW